MNDIITTCRVEGSVLLDGEDIYEAGQDVVRLRSRIGMVSSLTLPEINL